MRPTKDLLYLHWWMLGSVLQSILQKCTAFDNVTSSHRLFQTFTPIPISVNNWLAVVFQCSIGNYSYMLLADNKPVISQSLYWCGTLCPAVSSYIILTQTSVLKGVLFWGVRKILHWKSFYLDKIVKDLFTHAVWLWNSRSYLFYNLNTTMHFTQSRVIATVGSGGKLELSTC